ncbi:hypothetical protein BAE44_0006278 [Dichanthelium oligosanthes]|uniref:SET domain-containing protein n=1 Tax=Dichanthelium oligosanthes TaxID=888268 RepID=A0A1E5W5U6_9POAL|nr:hypothetical protein BAE44_0006278 [Dichanthelium oligosanthes]
MAAAAADDAKLESFLQWLQANGTDLRGCTIRACGGGEGFGVFSTAAPEPGATDGVVLVVPLDLAITAMRVLQDPLVGPRCRALFEEGGIDDRLLVMLFLMAERRRPGSLWKPYLDMLPSSFGSSLWFSEEELAELEGTTLYRATVIQELLYLYGFVVDNNPDDFLMVHYPVEALKQIQSADVKMKLLEIQKGELRCLLPRSLLDNGFFGIRSSEDKDNKKNTNPFSSYSWSGQRKVPSYLHKIVFPQEFMSTLRTIAMQEHELEQVASLLGEVESSEDREPSDAEIQSAIWESNDLSFAAKTLLSRAALCTRMKPGGTVAVQSSLVQAWKSSVDTENFTLGSMAESLQFSSLGEE